MRKITSLIVLLALIFGLPFISNAQTELEVLTKIANAAEHDAEADADADGCLYFCGGFSLALGGGCFLGALSLVPAYSYRPSPPLSRLTGKPPEYIAVYVDTYKEQRRSTAASAAIVGCTLGAATAGCLALAGVTPWSTALQESVDEYGHGVNVVLTGISRVAVIKSW